MNINRCFPEEIVRYADKGQELDVKYSFNFSRARNPRIPKKSSYFSTYGNHPFINLVDQDSVGSMFG